MSDAVRVERCAEVAAAALALIPAIFEGKSNPVRLEAARPSIARIKAVVEAGSDGIDEPRYLAWLGVAPTNLRALEEAIDAGDADAAFAAFSDPQIGLNLLAGGCEGCPGW